MAIKDRKKGTGFLARLRRDEAGNTIAIFAAAIFPAIGLIGGGVDVSRMYLVQTRLQAACDAGSLMGRKVMNDGAWDANGGEANTRALEMFDTNFAPGSYGTSNLQRSFSGESGNVSGTASVTVPMTLMKVFDKADQTISASCLSELRIPNTDVMFVLDVTGSMGWCSNSSSSCSPGSQRIDGLRTAVSCFYEALAKNNITAVSAEDCNETSDPSEFNEGDVRLRFGFVPYNVNVNVGRLLPHDYLADNWTYQSRRADYSETPIVNSWEPTIGSEGPYVLTDSSNNSGTTSWRNRGYSIRRGNLYWNSIVYPRGRSCSRITPPPPITVGGGNAGNYVLVSETPNPLTYPATEIVKTYERSSGGGTTYEYRYNRRFFGFRAYCVLQYRTSTNSGTETYTTTTPVTWTPNTDGTEVTFDRWEYRPVSFDVSGLKSESVVDGWNNSVNLPIGEDGQMATIPWNGCIEERQTFRNTDGNPSDDWSPIPGTALDMDIDLEPDPSNSATQWGPSLPEALWIRETSGGSRTTDTFFDDESGYQEQDFLSARSAFCPAQASLYKEWGANDFWSYLSSLTPNGNTYHDIGLLWGARLMSPTGIFSDLTDDNEETPPERHMVFMTDGDTTANSLDYSPYGIHWWDRRQTNDTSPSGTDDIEPIVNARVQAICDQVKNNMNVTLWVVSFGPGVGTDTETALQQCASSGKFFRAADSDALVARFKQIAADISNLRLTE